VQRYEKNVELSRFALESSGHHIGATVLVAGRNEQHRHQENDFCHFDGLFQLNSRPLCTHFEFPSTLKTLL
jgi:hypothetical protein